MSEREGTPEEFSSLAAALRGQSSAAKRETDRALVEQVHPPDEGDDREGEQEASSPFRFPSAPEKREADRKLVDLIHPQPTDGGDGASAEPPNTNAGELAALAAYRNDAALVASIHEGVSSGEGTGGFDGGARDEGFHMPRDAMVQPVAPPRTPSDDPSLGPGWSGPEYEVDVAAILPGLVTDER